MQEIFADFVSRISSRKFMLVFGMGLVFLADNFGLKIDPEIRTSLVTLVVAYLVAEGAPDAIRAYKE
jgi:hypothetical protein